MSAYEENLERRREKLRDLVWSEETRYSKELAEETRKAEDSRLEGMRARTQELWKQREEAREATVAAKRMQQYLATCPDVKLELSRRRAIDAKRCNVTQIADNEAKRSAERDLDQLWHQLMLRELEAKKREETKESERRALAKRETSLALSRQLEDRLVLVEEEKKRVLQDEREQLERLWDEVRQAELRNLEAERQKREILKRDLEEQILTAKRLLVERAREEAAVDRGFRRLVEEDLAREKAETKRNTAALRAELLAYLGYLEDLRQEEARRNLEVEVIIEQSHEDIQARRELAMKRFKEARQRVAQEVLRGREEQLRVKREAEEEDRRLKVEEREAVKKRVQMDANLMATEKEENRQRALCYGLELQEQHRSVQETKLRESEEDRRYHREEATRRADEYQRLTEELLKASENITPHPFKVLLKECAERRAAERERHHYCPPVLTSA
ncbi:LOW QUALITY PROTEIN: trichohyalin-like [Nylanderia fulva]|uniref:LOW QUALITY PROTEIN: trichohyalin-like n=1 Tax=Nylanderia fulva TaxID=613905 RepID=UPI0010FB46F2|nr:LOW QUALITY PROTEIN: trichohyalin-like [Nylanderia fulva]